MARRDMAARNRAAQQRLREMGHDPGPVKGAEYRLRKALGAQRGLSAGQSSGKPRKGERSVSELRARGEMPAPSRRVRPRPPRDVEIRGSRIVTTSDMRHLFQQIRAAAREGQRIAMRVTADGGEGPRTRSLAGDAEQQQLVQRRAAELGTAGNHRRGRRVRARQGITAAAQTRGEVQVIPPVQMVRTADPDVLDGAGFDPDEMLDWLDTYDDPWDPWADLWGWAQT